MVVDGAIHDEVFLAYVKQFLVPILRLGGMMILDYLSAHKVAGVKKAIETLGAKVLYFPPYSSDCNPTERVCAKLKTLVRKLKWRKVEE
jgi:transposase